MGGGQTELSGPDLAAGVKVADVPEGAPFLGHAQGEAVVLVRRGEEAGFCRLAGLGLAMDVLVFTGG